ncbi:MAG: hypothetical protein IJ733_09565 [Lachnospiraceae bacterium]|nr:hypothetical protein [Lachnospiraceae bacterium]
MMKKIMVKEISGNPKAPVKVMEYLAGKTIEEQSALFRLEYCRQKTYWLDAREIKNPVGYHGDGIPFVGVYPIIVQDGAIVGIDIGKEREGEELYWYVHPCSSICSYSGHRIDCEYGYEEDHDWYIFRYLEDVPRSMTYPFR